MQGKLAILLNFPVCHIGTAGRNVGQLHLFKSSIGGGNNPHFPVAGFQGLQSGDVPDSKIGNGAIAIVIQTVHTGAADAAIVQKAVPPLPDGGCPQIYAVEPGGEFLLQEQVHGKIHHTIVCQRLADQGRAHEAAADPVAVPLQTAAQSLL